MTEKIAGRITKTGLAALKNSEPMEPEMELMLELLSRVDQMNRDNCITLCMQLCETFGNAELALEALKNGDVEITKAS